ncbi:MAG: NFACT family protein [Clostridia bacterium]|nr:NFACT family protein [Clostridia bacterium]
MPQDAFTLRRNAFELNALLVGGKINKIIQPSKDDLLLYIYTGKSLLKLVMCANASFNRVCLTSYEKEPPLVAPNFCMLLRKHLLGAEIKKVEQVGFERILAFTLHCASDFSQTDRVLYAEIMGKYSNVILTENGVILGALKTTSLEENHKRILFPGATYALPEPQDKVNPADKAALTTLFENADETADLAHFLFTRVSGVAYPTAAEIATEYVSTSGMGIADFVYAYLFEGETAPCVTYVNGEPKDFGAKFLHSSRPFKSLQAAQD